MSENCRVSRWIILKNKLNNLSPEAFRKTLEEEKVVLIDCRKPEEVAQQKMEGAINVDYLAYDFLDQLGHLNPKQKILVYCRSERRSIRTCTLMQNGGFEQVYNLDGGLNAWVATLGDDALVST